MKRYIKLTVFFLISILICLIFFNVYPKIKEYFGYNNTIEYSLLEKEILLTEMAEKDKLTMVYIFPTLNKVDMETDSFHKIMLAVSQTFPQTIQNKIYSIDSDESRKIQKYLNKTMEDSFAVLIDNKGYIIGFYTKPINEKTLFTELTYATN